MTWFVNMQDSFLSGWGEARNGRALYCIRCTSYSQAIQIAAQASSTPSDPHKRSTEMTDFPDTPDGARAVLRDFRSWVDGENPEDATFIPDPEVTGCWLARMPSGRRFIVYTDGHPHGWGPDFEEVLE